MLPAASLAIVAGMTSYFLVPKLPHNSKAKWQGYIWSQEIALGAHVSHDLSPFGHHGVTFPLHFVGTCVQENGVLVDQCRSSS